MILLFAILHLVVVHGAQIPESLECYSCSGGEKCGILFSPNAANVKIVKSGKTESLLSCSISVTPEGLTTRSLVASHECRSSPSQFCCNENLCNRLAAPPLPAFTSLKCAVGKCSMSNGICIYDDEYITTLSSPTESCSVTFGAENYKYYKKGCQPTIKDTHVARISAGPTKPDMFCCNSPLCNTGHMGSPIRGVAIQCYTCDSRLSDSAGCTIFNESSPNVYKAGSSSNEEVCATIVGLSGRDAVTGKPYPAFTIRTFIPKCVNQPLGYISYGGAYFKGRVECCSSHFCNTGTLNTKEKTRKLRRWMRPIVVVIIAVTALLIIITIVITCAVYRYCRKKSKDPYGPVATKEPEISLDTLKNKINKKRPQQSTTDNYPEECATP